MCYFSHHKHTWRQLFCYTFPPTWSCNLYSFFMIISDMCCYYTVFISELLSTLSITCSPMSITILCRADPAQLHQFFIVKQLFSWVWMLSTGCLFFSLHFLLHFGSYQHMFLHISHNRHHHNHTADFAKRSRQGTFLFSLSITYNIAYLCVCVVCVMCIDVYIYCMRIHKGWRTISGVLHHWSLLHSL